LGRTINDTPGDMGRMIVSGGETAGPGMGGGVSG
jgi:hypothetical protein